MQEHKQGLLKAEAGGRATKLNVRPPRLPQQTKFGKTLHRSVDCTSNQTHRQPSHLKKPELTAHPLPQSLLRFHETRTLHPV
ncbi:hypothetical protein LDENG_00070590 [Lucifuga dentata]|nr:hypothetical protein LDENG_00070590 [Lucifuga dentata]